MEQEKLLTAREVADLLRIHPLTPYEWVKGGKLTPVRIAPRCLRFKESEVRRIMAGERNE